MELSVVCRQSTEAFLMTVRTRRQMGRGRRAKNSSWSYSSLKTCRHCSHIFHIPRLGASKDYKYIFIVFGARALPRLALAD